MNCKPEVLVNGIDLFILQCKGCKRISLSYHNIMLGFDQSEFINFSKAMHKLIFERNAVPFTQNQQKIVINTCHDNIQLSFTKIEFNHLNESLQQARLILNARKILEKNNG